MHLVGHSSKGFVRVKHSATTSNTLRFTGSTAAPSLTNTAIFMAKAGAGTATVAGFASTIRNRICAVRKTKGAGTSAVTGDNGFILASTVALDTNGFVVLACTNNGFCRITHNWVCKQDGPPLLFVLGYCGCNVHWGDDRTPKEWSKWESRPTQRSRCR